MINKSNSIMLAGVGGQGTLLAARVLGTLFLAAGHDVKVSEVHGMSQRGGSVVTYVKWGEKVYSPVVDKGEADFVLAFEQMEGARWTEYLKPSGKLILNRQKISPMPCITGAAKYNENIEETLISLGVSVIALDALKLAEEAGSPRAVNVVLIGVLSGLLDFPVSAWESALIECVPPKALDINMKAFELGKNYK